MFKIIEKFFNSEVSNVFFVLIFFFIYYGLLKFFNIPITEETIPVILLISLCTAIALLDD
jgi:lipopolysaccharide export LptBFGC system permease protein LptF